MQRAAFRKLRACAGVAEASAHGLGAKCRENVDAWVEELNGVDVRKFEVAARRRPPRSPLDEIKRKIKRYLEENRDERHAELKSFLQELHGGAPAAPPALEEPEAGVDEPPALPVAPPADAEPVAVDEALRALQALRREVRDRVEPLYPVAWHSARKSVGTALWDPMNWSSEDLEDVKAALERREHLAAGRLPASAAARGAWPTLEEAHHQVSPACSVYASKADCVWPCAWKSGRVDRKKLCRPARAA